MKNEYDPSDYHHSGDAGRRVVERARNIYNKSGDAFILFIGSIASASNAITAFKNIEDARDRAREEVKLGTPRELIHLKKFIP
jgi:hypothetical protein